MNAARIYYHRPDGEYADWYVYSWGSSAEPNDYGAGPTAAHGTDPFGVFFDIRLHDDPADLGFLIHNLRTGAKDPGSDMHLDLRQAREAWIVSGHAEVALVQPTPAQVLSEGFSRLQAFWIDRTTLALPARYFNGSWNYSIAYSRSASLEIADDWTLKSADLLRLKTGTSLTPLLAERFPQLAGYAVLHLDDEGREALKSQHMLVAADSDGRVKYITGLQIAGVLDDLFAYSGVLGTAFEEAHIAIRVWAPTAQAVELLLFRRESDSEPASSLPMTEANGVWSVETGGEWKGGYYLLRVSVYVPSLHAIVQNTVTDPYSMDLALNGAKTRLTDLHAAETKPEGWDASLAPALGSTNDLSIYELHVRDFSANDASVEGERRGTYLAFSDESANGMRHLQALATAGLKAVHLLPTFHFSSVNEDKSSWQSPGDLSAFAADGSEQQEAIARVQAVDAYNWGYDPVHYLAPSGAYAVDPSARVKEYRQMVLGLHRAGLRVIQDVVFNHTVASGQAANSVLDKIVPGYYQRLDPDGNVYASSCCANTASEHRMMEKLMVDAVVHHAREYKISGFRFDLMGLHFTYNLQHIKEALNDSSIYLYGEGWEIGETANGALGPNASQKNIYGTGVGVFNDRVRDGIRGGSPFSDPRTQGFATGDPRFPETDWIRVALAGNLRDYSFTAGSGETLKGSQISYNGAPAGYTARAIENINFCSVHDNRILFDAMQMKAAASEDMALRVRRQVLAMSLIALGQGIPFFQAGDDLLRSKDMDTDSFDSGDWFNRLDFSYQSANWGIGLPLAEKNKEIWPIAQPLLANPALKPKPEHIAHTRKAFLEFLRIRYSSRLFRMDTLEEIQHNLQFGKTGPYQTPGVIVMLLGQQIVVVFNAMTAAFTWADQILSNSAWQLHPVQAASSDLVVRQAIIDPQNGKLTTPALTTAVFVLQ